MQLQTVPSTAGAADSSPRSGAGLRQVVANAVLFNLVWAACVIGAAHANPWLGAIAALAMVAAHLRTTPNRRSEFRLIGLTVLIGFTVDSIFSASGLLQYEAGVIVPWLAPVWILSLWVAFGTTLNLSLRWLKNRWWLAMILGAVSGPLSYLSGSRLGAVEFSDTGLALICLSITWAILLPSLAALAVRSDAENDAMSLEPSHA
ncbi:MAG: DUF2878 domain-containing protein [Wenzhouxiangella sp.]|jgi:hypothetical protein|nr:DUF2878 domain-containing protein [Wenzhouxiangella sp.]